MAAAGEIEDFSYSRDLLRRFAGGMTAPEAPTEVAGGDFGGVELSLGLSLGGCFGEPREKGVVRSSSVSVFPPESRHAGEGEIARTCSLPAEIEEEWRRRKEMQSLKRMEAKRKRSEKRAKEEEVAAAAAGPAKEAKGAAPRWAAAVKPASQGSIGSSGSSSSGVLDFESKPLHGLLLILGVKNSNSPQQKMCDVGYVVDEKLLSLDATALNGSGEVRSPSVSVLPMLSKPTNPPEEEEDDEPSKKKRMRSKEMERSMMEEEMPCVSTRGGGGPNGRRIEGFLYKYRKGGEVRIVCVCHGSFLTPAEFVEHAGGGDVDHPLRHIVVNPNPSVVLL